MCRVFHPDLANPPLRQSILDIVRMSNKTEICRIGDCPQTVHIPHYLYIVYRHILEGWLS